MKIAKGFGKVATTPATTPASMAAPTQSTQTNDFINNIQKDITSTQKKSGRKSVSESKRKSQRLLVACSIEEKAIIEKWASNKGVSVTAAFRMALLEKIAAEKNSF